MTTNLVLESGCSYDRLGRSLKGWRSVSESSRPILPGEPEYAVFERGPGERIHYTMNPVCALRVLEVPSGLEAELRRHVPVVDEGAIATWLQAEDERTVLRGVLAAGLNPTSDLIEHVVELRSHAVGAVARAAAQVSEKVGATSRIPAQELALASTRLLEQQLEPLLRSLGRDTDGSLSASLRPRPEDYAKAFLPHYVQAARAAYEAVWAQAPRVDPVSSDRAVECHVAPAGMLAGKNELSFHFPGGYRYIAPLLDPHRVWVRWKYVRPGASAGQSYDGLVWLDDHWAWFPKPYRVLHELGSDHSA